MPNIQVRPAMLPYSTARNTPNSSYDWLGGNQGEGIVSELHDRYFYQMYNRNVFCANLTTAATIPISTTTNGITLGLWNPSGSGVLIVPIAYIIGYTGTTGVAGAAGYFQVTPAGNALATAAPLSAFTGTTITGGMAGQSFADGSIPVRACSAATVTAAGTLWRWSIFSEATPATTNGGGPYLLIDDSFKGSAGIPPGTFVYPAANAAFASTFMQSFIFYLAPWP